MHCKMEMAYIYACKRRCDRLSWEFLHSLYILAPVPSVVSDMSVYQMVSSDFHIHLEVSVEQVLRICVLDLLNF